MQSLLISVSGEGLCGPQLTAAPQKVLRSPWSLCRAQPHFASPRLHLGPWTSACNSPAFTPTRLERKEPSTRLCKPQSNLRAARLCEFWVGKKGLGSPTLLVRTEGGKRGLVTNNQDLTQPDMELVPSSALGFVH